MGLFKRMNDVVRSNINALLDKAEDPVKLANQYLSDMGKDVADAERELTNVMGQEKLIKSKIHAKECEIEKRNQQIADVLDRDEALAKELIASKQELESVLTSLRAEHEKMANSVHQLKPAVEEMKREYDKLRQRRDMLIAKSATAKAEQKVYQALGGIGVTGTTMKENFARLEEKIESQTARAEASKELVHEQTGSSLDYRVSQLTASSVDEEFARLKENRMKQDANV